MITLLLRLYPARWRARYGDEFELILSDRPLGPFDVVDVLLGALDAHLHLRGLGSASAHEKGFAMTLRVGGYAAILGGLLWFIVLAWNAINDGAEGNATWIGLLLLAAVAATLVALVGLSAFQARRYPALTWAAVTIPAAGGVVALLGAVAITVTGDSDRAIVGGLSGWWIATMGVLAMLTGSGLFAVATWRARSLSRRASGLLAIGAIAVVPALTGLSNSLVPEQLAGIVIAATIIAFPAGWAALGVSALRTDGAGTPAFEGVVP